MTTARTSFAGTVGALALALAACSTDRPAPPPAPRAAPVVRSIAVSPAQYMAAAASAALFVVRASQLIAAREGDSGLGQSAGRFGIEQGGIGAQLSTAGRRINLLPSATLLPRHQAMLDDIAASSDPSAAYVRHLGEVLPRALDLHRQYELYGTSPTLRPVAAMAAPIIARELDELRRR